MNTKTCAECSRELPLQQFYKDASKADGYFSWCKKCVNCGVKKDPAQYGTGQLLGDPSPELIALQCAKFQAEWSEDERANRACGKVWR